MLLQIPGGPELLVILLVMALLVGVPVVLAALFLFVRFVGGGDDGDEVAELRDRIEELEAQVAAGSDAPHDENERAEDGRRGSDDG
ncbi:preprotein translocase subunit TatA [Halolamina sp. C58]|uniref:preprotein translocase subunit TatA n=1 Tax=Halolamina sp. C58 TaxID=3421640 RepID=UPI003EBE54A2